jgi:hypothetical protein
MRKVIPLVAASVLAMGTAAVAAEGTGAAGRDTQPGVRMQGSPNAAGFTGKSDTAGTTRSGSPGSEMPRAGSRMQGPPNAAGFQQGDGKATGGAAGNAGGR